MGVLLVVGFLLLQWTVGDMSETKPKPVIWGGHVISIEEAPYMARYIVRKNPKCSCGASILTERFVLSAAHCTKYSLDCHGRKDVSVGSDTQNDLGQLYEIEKIIKHPEYDFNTLNHDIFVAKLKNSLTFSEKVQAINLADSNVIFDDRSSFETMGFGLTEKGEIPDNLHAVSVPYVDTGLCRELYNTFPMRAKITDDMICAGSIGKDSCMGDSGGPLVYNGTLAGVVSFGYKCGILGVYTSVPRHREFIDTVIKQNS